MNEFTKENRGVSSETLLTNYRHSINTIDFLIKKINEDKKVSLSSKKEFALLIPNYSSCIKTIICRYLKGSGYSNQRLNNFSTTELFFKFKKELAKDNSGHCTLSAELHLVVLNIRNKLSHTLNQVNYISEIVEKSGTNKIVGLLKRMSVEAKEIEKCFEQKLTKIKEVKIENAEDKTIPNRPFGIVY